MYLKRHGLIFLLHSFYYTLYFSHLYSHYNHFFTIIPFFFSKLVLYFYFIFLYRQMKLYCMAFNEASVWGHLFYCLANAPVVIHVGHSVYTLFFFYRSCLIHRIHSEPVCINLSVCRSSVDFLVGIIIYF